MTDTEEIRTAIHTLAIKYSPDESEDSRNKVVERTMKQLSIVEISINHMTGKEAIELVKKSKE